MSSFLALSAKSAARNGKPATQHNTAELEHLSKTTGRWPFSYFYRTDGTRQYVLCKSCYSLQRHAFPCFFLCFQEEAEDFAELHEANADPSLCSPPTQSLNI